MIKLFVNHKYSFDISNIISLFYGKMHIDVLNFEALENNQSFFLAEDIILQSRIDYIDNNIKVSASIKTGDIVQSKEDIFILHSEKQVKSGAKLIMYKLLSELLQKSYPWGILTGIRPLKLIHDLMDKDFDREYIVEYMKTNYLVNEEKVNLAVDIANCEREILYPIDDKKVSIYIGIPFCPTRCHYCSFTSNSMKSSINLVDDYLKALLYEMEQTALVMNKYGLKTQTIYIGGGTPTSLNELQLDLLLSKATEHFGGELEEFTCEAGRPDTITAGKLEVMKQRGVTRISINPQTMNDETLMRIGRAHTTQQTIDSFLLARKLGFNNINMDIILGLPGEGLGQLDYTLKEIEKLKPESITIHTLAIKKSSIINENLDAYEQKDVTGEMMKQALMFTYKSGMHPYYLYRQKHMAENLENIGCCMPGFESIYNIQIIEEKQSNIAFGADAITKTINNDTGMIKRQGNIKDLKLYISNIENQIKKKIQLIDELYN